MVTVFNPSKTPDPEIRIPTNRKKPKKKRKTVMITARIHPGESPSSYVCQGMMNFLLSDDPGAKTLRDSLTFVFIPMLNPDGVFLGNYRTSLLGQDLNRCWSESSPHAHPTLTAVKGIVESFAARKDEELDMCLDLHAHTGLLGTFVYGNSYEDVYRFQRHTLFPKHLSYCAEDFSLKNTAYNKDPGKSGTSRRFFSKLLKDKVNCYTLEVSFYGYESQKGSSKVVTPYNEEEYLRLGESICRSMLDYYCAISYITADDLPLTIRDLYVKGRGRGRGAGRSSGPSSSTAAGGRARGGTRGQGARASHRANPGTSRTNPARGGRGVSTLVNKGGLTQSNAGTRNKVESGSKLERKT